MGLSHRLTKRALAAPDFLIVRERETIKCIACVFICTLPNRKNKKTTLYIEDTRSMNVTHVNKRYYVENDEVSAPLSCTVTSEKNYGGGG